MRRIALFPVVLCVIGTPLARAAPSAALPNRAAVDDAIEKGVRWLLAEQRPDGSFGAGGSNGLGQTALGTLALLHAGLREEGPGNEDARLARLLALIDRQGPGREGHADQDPGTYAVSLLLLVLRTRGREADRPRMQRLADLLARIQAENGQWAYHGEPGETGRGGPDVGDNSNTQFAVLALGAAAGEGLTVPSATLARARSWWLRAAAEDGGFGYDSGGSPDSASRGSMTCAGISSLAILEAARGTPGRGPIAPEVASTREKALTWLAQRFTVAKNPGSAPPASRARVAGLGWNLYYLWAFERACVLAGTERVGEHDWFAEGTAHVLAQQRKDGSWVEKAPLVDTCFALLFLTRAADPPRVFTPPPKTTGPITPDAAAPAPPTAPAPSAAGPADPWAEPPIAPALLVERALAEGPASLQRFVRALDDADPKVRQRAFEALTVLLGEERVENADRHPLPRGRLALWIRRQMRFLVVKDGRFALP